ncbi:MAG TPA: ribosomal L7Ae/L30e/S12e/Gadd45 family protein [Candidatus Limiplasma sp.]|nr:ribosomal L7Ae/L30e/S12e/Gadd45 family protein [Candidatus Limiplasma sp.]HRX09536.1 ribosomal L7Ae/L30e/S12e/Gadd45 family protein [Candidatus Limiplasma sp.]
MDEALRNPAKRVVGLKQVLRAVKSGQAAKVYLCTDADEFIYRQVESACEEHKVPIIQTDSMEALGKACLIAVKTAAAAILR